MQVERIPVIMLKLVLIWAAVQAVLGSRIRIERNEQLKCDVSTTIDSGKVCGVLTEAEQDVQCASFMGIPYAKQPLGSLRFAELQPIEPWDGVFAATEEGHICPQYDEFFDGLTNPRKGMSESCINVNVHVPLNARPSNYQGEGLPIVVYIHGGGFVAGSGTGDIYGHQYLASQGVIVVTFNYRIGAMGWLSLNSTSIPGNNGLRDTCTFLAWLRRNARAFHGNPNEIMMIGYDSGAAIAQMVSLANENACEAIVGVKGVIVADGAANAGYLSTSPTHAADVAEIFLDALDITSTDADTVHSELVSASLDDILKATRIVQQQKMFTTFSPVAELYNLTGVTPILDNHPLNLMALGRGLDIPMMIGYSENGCNFYSHKFLSLNYIGLIQENSKYLLPANILYNTNETYAETLGDLVLAEYFNGSASNVDLDSWLPVCSFIYYGFPVINIAKLRVEYGYAPTYLYQYAYSSDNNIIRKELGYKGYATQFEVLSMVLRNNHLLKPDEKCFPPRTRDDLMKYGLTKVVADFASTCEVSGWEEFNSTSTYYAVYVDDPLTIKTVNMSDIIYQKVEFHSNLASLVSW